MILRWCGGTTILLAFARSEDQGDNGGSDQQGSSNDQQKRCDPNNGNPFGKECGGSTSDWVCTPATGVLHNKRTGFSINNGCTG
jgi:hypothetical protein